jgi:hypothetical protein
MWWLRSTEWFFMGIYDLLRKGYFANTSSNSAAYNTRIFLQAASLFNSFEV